MENHYEIDERIDREVVEISGRYRDFIIDSRMAWHFIPDAFKVYLIVDGRIAAQRVFCDSRVSENYSSIETALEKLTERRQSEKFRYKHLYNVDLDNFGNYNLVLDTSYITPDEVLENINRYYNEWLNDNSLSAVLISANRIYPLRGDAGKIIDRKNGGINVLEKDGDFFIYDDNLKAASLIKSGHKLIGCKVVNDLLPDASAYIKNNCDIQTVKDWETANNIKYPYYPRFLK
jgi:cytidylate kinase